MGEKRTAPEVKPGLWSSPRQRVAARRVIRIERWKYKSMVMVEGMGMMPLAEFRAWAVRNEAACLAEEADE